jgi:adenylate cyclase
MIEIERKFLVNSTDFIKEFFSNYEISQGYLSTNPERTVRVRIKGNEGYLTIKGPGNDTGMSRFEWEKEIDVDEAKQLLLLCEKEVISKIRYNILNGKQTFEVDVFSGENHGLIIAEIELESENEIFEKPAWLGEEVTNDERYYNAYLSQKPFLSW